MNRLGQSAFEYLATYSWMLILVAVISGIVLTSLPRECNTQVSGFQGNFPKVEKATRFQNETLAFKVANPSSEDIQTRGVSILQDGQVQAFLERQKEVNEEGRENIITNRFRRSNECQEYTIQLNYSSNTIGKLVSKGKIQGKLELIKLMPIIEINPEFARAQEEIEFNGSKSESQNPIDSYTWNLGDGTEKYGETITHNYSTSGVYGVKLEIEDNESNTRARRTKVYIGNILFKEGGYIPSIKVENTLSSTCIGGNCSNVTVTNKNSVSTRGDNIEGTVLTKKLIKHNSEMCITSETSFNDEDGCPEVRKGESDVLSEYNNIMHGSLRTQVIKPKNQDICIGDC